MSTYKELQDYYKSIYGKELNGATINTWVKNGRLPCIKLPNKRRDYDIDKFKEIVTSDEYKKQLRGHKTKPTDVIGKTRGYLLVKGIVPKNEYKTNYPGTLMYCDCLLCGSKNNQIRLTYLTKDNKYNPESCGCIQRIRHFLACSREGITESFLLQFGEDFNKFLFIHKALTHMSRPYYLNCDIDEYKNALIYFYNDKQFNCIYDNWIKNKDDELNVFYDWLKPSLDHKIPKSKDGSDKIDNLQFLTVFENLTKRDLSYIEWEEFKQKTNTTSEYFLESILKKYEDKII